MKDIDTTPSNAASQLKRALFAVKDLRRRLAESEHARREPIAILGASCRFPGGVDDLEGYWRFLRDGTDGIAEVPPERWDAEAWYDPDPDVPGKMTTRWGGFLAGVDHFDAAFFGISPREAASMDPQHRFLLEGAWHALEHAGQAPERLFGTPVGVFVGISTNDYANLLATPDHTTIDAYASLGNSASMAAGRLSYTLGLTGPSMSVDTACSSSLVAVHLAVQSLRHGECPLALAAGVNLILSPALSINFSKARMMAADGRCKTFDAAADGYVRGEGCGVVVLKRLSDAMADGDQILAVIRGSAVNQDGPSSGLTAPNGPAQEAVIRNALRNAELDPSLVSYVETHGTGTALGDPIEMRALLQVFSKDRAHPFFVGSVKTNIGHLEAAAGIAGLLKAVVALQHGEIPPHLHFHTLNPQIASNGFPLQIPTTCHPWAPIAGQRIAGVSSFGFSGTNAHVVLEEAPATELRQAQWERSTHLLCLSAKTAEALRESATRHRTSLSQSHISLGDFCYTAHVGRSHFRHRLAVVADSVDEMQAGLAAFVDGQAIAAQADTASPPSVAFLFTGQGSQYTEMGRALYNTQPRFRDVLDRCDALLRGHLERALLSVLFEPDSPIDDTVYAQPALFALAVALVELWRSWGIEPKAVLGHSVGEYAAAHIAGVFDLETGLTLVAARGRLMQSLPRGGAMAVVCEAAERIECIISAQGTGLVAVAADNGPQNTVISGDATAIRQVLTHLEQEGIAWQALHVSHAFHSPLLEPMLDAFERRAGEVSYSPACIPVVSNLTGHAQWEFDAAYWRQHARRPVRFAQGLDSLVELGCEVFLEIGPHPVLTGMGRACREGGWWLPSLRRGSQDWRTLLESLGRLYTLGADVDWTAFDRDYRRRKVVTPSYPFQRQRHWVDMPSRAPHTFATGIGHPLLGHRLRSALKETIFEIVLDTQIQPFLADHRVFDEVVVPGAAHLSMALSAAHEVLHAQACVLEDVVFAQALTVPKGGRTVQCIVRPEDQGALCELYHLSGEEAWTLHAAGKVRSGDTPVPAPISLATLQTRCRLDEAGPEALYTMLDKRGLRLGPAFRGITRLWRGDGEALAEIHLPDTLTAEAASCQMHPVLLDACFQALGATFVGEEGRESFVPVSLDRLHFYRRPEAALWCHVALRASNGPQPEVVSGDFRLYARDGSLLATAEGLHIKRTSQEAMLRAGRRSVDEWLYAIDWQPKLLADTAFLPSGQEIAAAVVPKAEQYRAELGLDRFRDLGPQLEMLATEYVLAGLRTLGWNFLAGERVNLDTLLAHLGVVPRYRRLLARLCDMLQEDGTLAPAGPAAWAVLQELPSADAEAHSNALLSHFPECRLEIGLVGRCGRALADTLRGATDPLQLLFPTNLEGNVYRDSPFARLLNTLIGAVFTEILERLPDGRSLCILEVGAGTGGTTATVLPLLPAERTQYVFTDISPVFLSQAQETLHTFPFVEYRTLDLDHDPETQGFATRAYDVILAANVLHATADVRRTLEQVKRLLAPTGLLVLLEGVKPRRWSDIVFGLTEGWWKFADQALRPSHPLLSQNTWLRVLEASGFSPSVITADSADAEQAVFVARSASGDTTGRWLILADGSEVAEHLGWQLHTSGEACRFVSANNCQREALDEFFAQERYKGVVYLPDPGQTSQESLCGGALQLIHAMVKAGAAHLWLVTSGAQPVAGAVRAVAPATLWGLGKVVALEHPELECVRVDLDPEATPESQAEALAHDLRWHDGEAEIAYRQGLRRVARLVRAALEEGEPVLRTDGTYLITGGLGGLGMRLAAWLADHGARSVALVGRHAPSEEARAHIARLESRGCSLAVCTADVSRREEVQRVLDVIDADLPLLRGIFHLAGGLDDGVLLQQNWSRFQNVFAAKVDGAWHLHELTRDRPLEAFVLFSTSVSLLGYAGQGNHAAANAFLDGLAHYRRGHALPGLSVNWGAWGETGSVVARQVEAQMRRQGVTLIPPDQGFTALGRAMSTDVAQIAVIPIQWQQFLRGYADHQVPLFFAEMVRGERPTRLTAAAGESLDLRATLASVAPDQRRARLLDYVWSQAAAVLGINPTAPMDPEQPLNELGLDSLMALELRKNLGNAVGKQLPATLLFNYATLHALTEYLASEVLQLDTAVVDTGQVDAAATAADLAEVARLTEQEMAALIDDELDAIIGGL